MATGGKGKGIEALGKGRDNGVWGKWVREGTG